jgi:nicotinamide mononucleotide transporter
MNTPIHLFGPFFTSALELISFVLAVITVVLNIRQLHWAWLFAIVSSATYAVVFYGAKLYGDMGLQGVFIAVSVWGWYQWLHGGDKRKPLAVTTCDRKAWIVSLVGWAIGFAILAVFLKKFTDTDVPHIDGFLTAGSLLGQVLLSRKKVENWIVWIVVDILYVGLYVYKGLMVTAVLYALFVALAGIGLVAWQRDNAREPA